MKSGREKLLSHILMVMAPLLVLFIITLAWFINSRTVGMSEMSFAAQDVGGVSIYPYATLEARAYDKTILSHKITWGEKLAFEDSHITIKNMVPGQCEYYLLVSNKDFTTQLAEITVVDEKGESSPLLRSCLGLYLLPTKVDVTKGIKDQTDAAVTLALTRVAEDNSAYKGMLTDALLKDWTNGSVSLANPTSPSSKYAYILAVFCDPVYGQNGPGAAKDDGSYPGGNGVHVGALSGTVSFSLLFNDIVIAEGS